MRSLLTMLGIIIGVAAVIAVVSIVQGLNYVIATQFEGVGVTYIMVFPRQDLQDPTSRARGDADLRRWPRGHGASQRPQLFNPVFYPRRTGTGREPPAHRCCSAWDRSHQEVSNHWVDRGRFFSDLDIQRSARVCMVGQEVIDELELEEPILGTDLIVGSSAFTIVGIMEYQGEMLGQNQDDFVLIPITTARDIYGVEAFKQLRLDFQAESPETVDQARDQMLEILRERHRLPEGMRNDFQILLQEELLDTIGGILGTITSVVAGVVSIALLVGGIGIMNIMLVSVTERTREIGVRKAVGARKSDILVQFLIEAVTISLFGGLLGVLGGWGLGILGAKAIPGFPPAHVPLWAIALGFGFAALVGIFFGTYPAAKASTLDPIEALRHE